MYSTSAAYKTALAGKEQQSRLVITITPKEGAPFTVTDNQLVPRSVSWTNKASKNSDFSFGAAYVGAFNFTMLNVADTIDRYSLFEAKVVPIVYVKTGENTEEAIPLGEFYVQEPKRAKKTIQLKCYDKMTQFDTPQVVDTFGTPFQLLDLLCDSCGVSFGMTEEEVEALPNGTEQLTLSAERVKTCRDAVSCIAAVLCGFATINRSGALEIRRFSTEASQTLTAARRTVSTIADYTTYFIGLRTRFLQSGQWMKISASVSGRTSGLVLDMGDLPVVQGVTETLQRIAQTIADELGEVNFTPAEVGIIADPSIDLGDCIEFEGVNNTADDILTPVTSFTWKHHGGMTVKGEGGNARLNAVTDYQTKQVATVETDAVVNEYAMKVYSNAEQITVDDTDRIVVTLNYSVNKDTVTAFACTIPFDMQKDGNLVFTYALNNEDVGEFTHYVPRGKSLVTLTNYFENEANTQYRLTVRVHAEYFESDNRRQDAKIGGLIDFTDTGVYQERAIDESVPSGTVPLRSVRAYIFASGINTTDSWDGNLLIIEQIQTVQLALPTITVTPIDEDVTTAATYPETAGITESIGLISLVLPAVTVKAVSESVIIGRKSMQMEIVPERAAEYAFDSEFVNVTPTAFTLRTDYTYLSEAGIIDSGVMKQCEVDLSEFSSASAISATATGEEDSRLPAEFQKVEYIDSTAGSGISSGQYIDTGITLTSTARVVIDTAITPVNSTHWAMHGVGSGSACFSIGTYNSTIYYGFNSSDINTGVSHVSGRRYVYDLDANNRTYKVHDTVTDTDIVNISISAYTGNSPYKFYIGRYSGGRAQYVPSKVYSCKIYDGGLLVADYVPCYRKADNEIGLYDLVSHTFKTNSGTGTFAKGADITGISYKTLISDETNVYTVANSALANVETVANLTAQTFADYGFTNLTDIADAQTDILALDKVTVMRWTQSEATPSTMAVSLTAVPNPQGIIATAPLIDVIGLDEINATYSGNPLIAINVDNVGWICYNSIDEQWEAASDDDGMSIITMQNIPSEEWETLLTGASSLKVRITLATTTDSVTAFEIVFLTN